MHKVSAEYTPTGDNSTNIKVFIRGRPPEDKSVLTDFISIDPENERKISIKDPASGGKKYGEVAFTFDQIFWTGTKQDDVYNAICENQLDHVLSGYNSCIFAYGQTGSGKTYSMFGEEGDVRGIIPRSVEDLFKSLNKRNSTSEVAMVCSFLEIYNDQIRDLAKAYLVAMGVETSNSAALFEKTSAIVESLSSKRGNAYFQPAFSKSRQIASEVSVRPGLKECVDEYNTMNHEIREDAEGNVFVKDLSLVPVSNLDEVMSLINMGLKVRATHETKMNSSSSRSHTVFSITVLQRDKLSGEAIQGTMNLIDLAGSERLKKSESQGVRLKEALAINTSLTALGKVIMALDPNSENTHVPFRDSKLTRILQNSLGGNSFTTVLAAIHPNPSHYDECLSTLQFANRCRIVKNNPRINHVVDNEDKDRKIKRLLEEIAQLRLKINQLEIGGSRGGGGGKGGGGAAMSPAALVQVLKKLGIKADIGADGNITANGATLGLADLAELGIGVGAEDSVSSSQLEDGSFAQGGGSGGGGGGMAGDGKSRSSRSKTGADGEKIVDKEKVRMNEMKEQISSLTSKAKERKVVLDEQSKLIQEMSNDIVKFQTIIKHKEFEYKCLMEEKERAVSQLKVDLESHNRVILADISKHNTKLLNAQQDTLLAVPDSFKRYTNLIRRMETAKEQFEGPIRAEFDEYLTTLDASRVTELGNMQKQYEFWLKERDQNLNEFVEKFNVYRQKKSEQIRMCEKEIIKLYEHIENLERLLNRIEKGEFTVRSHQGANGKSTTGLVSGGGADTMGGIQLPHGTRPQNPLYRPSTKDMELAKRLIQKHRERQYKLEKMKSDAFEKSLHHATRISSVAMIGNIDPVLQRQLGDLLVAPTPQHKHLKHGSNTNLGKSTNNISTSMTGLGKGGVGGYETIHDEQGEQHGDHDSFFAAADGQFPRIESKDDEAKDDLSQFSQNSKNINIVTSGPVLGVGVGGKHAEIIALRQEVAALRNLQHIQNVSVERVAQEVASEDTINYIRHLEDEIAKLRRSCQDAHSQLLNSKSAQAALSRKLEKAALITTTNNNNNTNGQNNPSPNPTANAMSKSSNIIIQSTSMINNNMNNINNNINNATLSGGGLTAGSHSTVSRQSSVRPSTGGAKV